MNMKDRIAESDKALSRQMAERQQQPGRIAELRSRSPAKQAEIDKLRSQEEWHRDRARYVEGAQFGNLVLLFQTKPKEWKAECVCGAIVDASYQSLYLQTLSGRCCGNAACDPTPTKRRAGRPKDLSAIGQEIGRFLVLDYTEADGWVAHCLRCEKQETFPTLKKLKHESEFVCESEPLVKRRAREQKQRQEEQARKKAEDEKYARLRYVPPAGS